jgi:hypothetical protein
MKLFRWLASNTMWFDFHLMAGTVGPMFIALHSVLRLDSWVSAAFWSMVITVVSGFLGRYLYTQVPELSSGVELEELDHERAFQKARPVLTVPMAEIDRELAEQRIKAQTVAQSPSTCARCGGSSSRTSAASRARWRARAAWRSSRSTARRGTISRGAPPA